MDHHSSRVYLDAVLDSFVDYAMLKKLYGPAGEGAAITLLPAKV